LKWRILWASGCGSRRDECEIPAGESVSTASSDLLTVGIADDLTFPVGDLRWHRTERVEPTVRRGVHWTHRKMRDR
jgi:hypothetical protein